jgi:hypothetical protein
MQGRTTGRISRPGEGCLSSPRFGSALVASSEVAISSGRPRFVMMLAPARCNGNAPLKVTTGTPIQAASSRTVRAQSDGFVEQRQSRCMGTRVHQYRGKIQAGIGEVGLDRAIGSPVQLVYLERSRLIEPPTSPWSGPVFSRSRSKSGRRTGM